MRKCKCHGGKDTCAHTLLHSCIVGSNFNKVPPPQPLPNIHIYIDLAVMPTPEVAYSNVLKIFITLGSASAMASSSQFHVSVTMAIITLELGVK